MGIADSPDARGERPVSGKWDGRKNLVPIVPGEVRNPTGRNQYTYRKDWERTIDAALKAGTKHNGTQLESIAETLLSEAEKGSPWAVKEVLKRVWPETIKHEHRDVSGQPPPAVSPLENLNDEDRATMLRLAQKAIRGGNTER